MDTQCGEGGEIQMHNLNRLLSLKTSYFSEGKSCDFSLSIMSSVPEK